MDSIVLCLLVSTAVTAALLPSEAISSYAVIGFLKRIHEVERFRSVFIYKKSSKDSFVDGYEGDFIKDLSTSLEIPIILGTDTSTFRISTKFNMNFLAIAILESITNRSTVQRLAINLHQMRTCKIVFILDSPSNDEEELSDLFKLCWKSNIINVLVVFNDFGNTSTFYRYTNMPTFAIEENLWMKSSPAEYFPDRMRDLKGIKLPLIFGGSEPKMIFSQNERGEPVIGGYAGHFFTSLAKKHNANLTNPNINKTLSAQQLAKLVSDEVYDISAATTYSENPMDCFTYPYEYVDWCLMLPIEPKIPINEIFLIVFRWETLLITIGFIVILSALLESASYLSGRKTAVLNYFLHDNCFRGALGQSFLEIPNASYSIKFIYLLICLIGIILVTSYNAFLQTYMTSPPTAKPIKSFDDLLASKVKVYSLKQEYLALAEARSHFKTKYSKIFVFENDFTKYVKFRDKLSPKYAYMVNNARWVLVKEQQKIFTVPLFRQPEGMCFLISIPMAFPINANSIYKDILNFMMLETHSSGLLEFWQRRGFNELITTGKLKLVDLTSKPDFVPIKVKDFKLFWLGICAALVLASLCFVCEVYTFRFKARRDLKRGVN